jgi:hypothetical protein
MLIVAAAISPVSLIIRTLCILDWQGAFEGQRLGDFVGQQMHVGRQRERRGVVAEPALHPIGTRVPANEYASYAGQVGRMLRERASTSDIAAHLAEARVESMGTAADPEADAEVATLLVAWYERETGDLG